jgi:hypothetical protein
VTVGAKTFSASPKLGWRTLERAPLSRNSRSAVFVVGQIAVHAL